MGLCAFVWVGSGGGWIGWGGHWYVILCTSGKMIISG